MEIYTINKNVTTIENFVISGLGDEQGKQIFESLFESKTFEEVLNNKGLEACLELIFSIAKKEYSKVTDKLDNFTFFFWLEEINKPICIIDMLDKGDSFDVRVFNPDDVW